ncbi:MAG: DUF262 domain-containing protein [Candidatus Binatia bacterium]
MTRSPRPQDISWFLDLNDKSQLDLDPPYQRKSVWSPTDRRFFIDTIMNGYPAPPVFFHKTTDDQGRTTYHVVDGKQRLQTIIDFTRNKIRIPENFSDVNLQNKRWNDLGIEEKRKFWNYEIVVEMLPDVSDPLVNSIFERINRNARKLTRQELRHAKYDGWFVGAAEAEAEKEEWKRLGVVTAALAKRMADVQFISELMAITIKEALQGFDQDALDDLYAEYEDVDEHPTFVEEDFRQAFEVTKDYIRELLDSDPGLVKFLKIRSHLYTLWGYLTLEKSRRSDPTEFLPRYRQFLDAVAIQQEDPQFAAKSLTDEEIRKARAEVRYALNTGGASTDLPARRARHDALVVAMHGAEKPTDEGQ